MKLKTKWTQSGHPSVWSNDSGDIVHAGGLARVGGRLFERNRYPDSLAIDAAVRVMGGNVKRGLMLFAESVAMEVSNATNPA